MVNRGQVWTVIRGSRQCRALIITNDEYNAIGAPMWALTITRDAPTEQLIVPLVSGDPLAGAHIRIPAVMQIMDRSELRESHGYVCNDTMNAVETALRDLLSLPV
jgi:mRNA interferase MazF